MFGLSKVIKYRFSEKLCPIKYIISDFFSKPWAWYLEPLKNQFNSHKNTCKVNVGRSPFNFSGWKLFWSDLPTLTLHMFFWPLTLKKAGGSYVSAAQDIACHFSQNHSRIQKLFDFFKNDVGPRVKESFWAYLDWLSRKWTEFDKNLQIFWGENHKLRFFSKCW